MFLLFDLYQYSVKATGYILSDAEVLTDYFSDEHGNNSEDDKENQDPQESPSDLASAPYSVQRKAPWTSLEKAVIKKVFAEHLSLGKTPNIKECYDAIRTNPELRQRSPPAVKTWVSSQLKMMTSSVKGPSLKLCGMHTLI